MPDARANRRAVVATAAFALVALAATGAEAVDKKALGRKASIKANYFANHGNCKEAIPLFGKAYRLLKDPAILFNRGECYRKSGKNAEAIADYKQFLTDFPAAPNRAQLETRIAELEGSKPADGGVPGAPGAAAAATAPTDAAMPVGPRPAPAASPGIAAATPSAREPLLEPGAAGGPATPGGTVADLDDKELAFKPLPGGPPPTVTAEATPPPAPPESGSVFGTWWFWTVVGVAFAGGVAGGYYAVNSGKTTVPNSPLGNYKF